MQVQVRSFDLLVGALERRLVDAHAVRKVRFEEVVVPSGDLGDGLGQLGLLFLIEVNKRALVLLADDHGFERPGCPPRADDQERLVLKHDALLLPAFQGGIVFQQMLVLVLPSVFLHLLQFHCGLLRQRAGSPDLTVGMGVRAAHSSALVLEDLHVPVLLLGLGHVGDGGVGR